MAYSELVKSFERIRSYMREFYVYGFKSREEYSIKSARSYDNERRRIESWIGDFMSFHQDTSGKNVFLSVDSRRIPHNPLHKAFKAKSFTDKDITLHFYVMDLLADGSALSSREIVDCINDDYLSHFSGAFSPDESTVRKKLKEYEALGLLSSEKCGREVLYRRTDDNTVDLNTWADALSFFSEEDPLGVIGSFLIDKLEKPSDSFRFKHHYMLHALDSDVLCDLLAAIDEKRAAELTVRSLRSGRDYDPKSITLPQENSEELVMLLHDERNGLERVLLHFSHFEKETQKLADRLYQIRLRYDKDDETELLIRVLSFGPVLEVIEPSAFVTLMRKRIAVQKQRFCQ